MRLDVGLRHLAGHLHADRGLRMLVSRAERASDSSSWAHGWSGAAAVGARLLLVAGPIQAPRMVFAGRCRLRRRGLRRGSLPAIAPVWSRGAGDPRCVTSATGGLGRCR